MFSKTLDAARHPGLTLVNGNIGTTVAALKSEPGRDIWLFGGGSLFASLLAAQVVDQIEVAIMPVLLGGGTPLVSAVTPRSGLILTRSNTSPSGIVNLQYQVNTRLANERCSRQALFGCGFAAMVVACLQLNLCVSQPYTLEDIHDAACPLSRSC